MACVELIAEWLSPCSCPWKHNMPEEDKPLTENGNDSIHEFRSVNSDIEVLPEARKRRATGDGSSEVSPALTATEMTKANMSTTRKPYDSDFTQQRMFGWQPILTPYNVLPVLFILGIIFVPLGIVFLTASMGIQEHIIDYTACGKASDWKPLSGGAQMRSPKAGECELQFQIGKPMKGPIPIYYRLTNFYQNNRLYANSLSESQLAGAAVAREALESECGPIGGPAGDKSLVYYPCGLIANSYFSDIFEKITFVSPGGTERTLTQSSQSIAWPGDVEKYKETQYDLSQIRPPPSWVGRADFPINDKGEYTTKPVLDERFMNWMKVSGLPTFRKLYGRIIEPELAAGTYKVYIKGSYDVESFKGTKSFVISTTNWAGGKNDAVGIGFIAVGGLLLGLGLTFLIMFMMSPRKVGDVSYLSWYQENAATSSANANESE